MKLKEVHIQQFKRFTDLKIERIPESAKLIMLTGPNGTGKSSLFEAFNFWASPAKGGVSFQRDYHWKVGNYSSDNWGELYQKITLSFHDLEIIPRDQNEQAKKAFYFRSAYRNEHDFTTSGVGNLGEILADNRRPQMLIMPDLRVSDNYQRLVSESIDALYDESNDHIPSGQLRDRLIGRIREAMKRVFPDLLLNGPGRPMIDGTFYFEKGASRNYKYKNLSGGEKAAFDLILDFVVKSEYFNNTIMCIDEPELHMHTRLQASLLKELLIQLPQSNQLWLATHSIGMIRHAFELYQEKPSEVVFIDFTDHDFDQVVTLHPTEVNRAFWKKIFSVALDDLAELVAPSELVFCEGRPEGRPTKRNTTFDAEVYRQIFSSKHPSTEFVPLGGSTEVAQNEVIFKNALARLFSTIKMWSLVDRDDRHSNEISELSQQGTRVLGRRDIESYLWDDEILTKLCASVGRNDMTVELISFKHQLLQDAQNNGKPSDDIKCISGQLYVKAKQSLALNQCGNSAEAFLKFTMAPLITSETSVFKELEQCIWRQ